MEVTRIALKTGLLPRSCVEASHKQWQGRLCPGGWQCCAPHFANICGARAHVHTRTCFELAADGDGAMQAGGIAQKRVCVYNGSLALACWLRILARVSPCKRGFVPAPSQLSIAGRCSHEHSCT